MLEMSGGLKVALKFYKKALYKTKDLEVAATAAFDIAKAQLDHSQKDAAKYVDKIIAAKPSYFKERYKESKDMMTSFFDYGHEETAAKIAKALLDSIDPTYDDYEVLLADVGLWLAQSDKKEEALQALNNYIKAFPDGDYLDKVKVAKDKLFFETSDANATVRLEEYNKLIEEYPDDTIGNKAIYERAKLLLKEKKYQEVLDSKEDILALDEDVFEDTNQIILDAAMGVMENSLAKKECKEVLEISSDYNVTLSDNWDDGIYECAMKGADFQLSKNMCEKNFKSKDLSIRKKWLYRYIKVDFATGNYSDVVDASEDLIALIDKGSKEDKKYYEVYRYLFDTYERLEKREEMLSAMQKIEEIFGLSYKDIERYITMMSYGSDRNDDTMVITYGKKVMQIQKESKSNAQSPYVEFMLYQAYMNLENFNSALEVIASLDKITLDNKDRSRQKYLKGTVLTKLWRDMEAKDAYNEAIKADANSAWAKLAKSALEI
jgi:tetratricopeptide (TPR) repeat protein